MNPLSDLYFLGALCALRLLIRVIRVFRLRRDPCQKNIFVCGGLRPSAVKLFFPLLSPDSLTLNWFLIATCQPFL